MTIAKNLPALLCVCLLGACGSFDTDGLPVKPHAAGSQPDPNCDRFATGFGGGAGCVPVKRERGVPVSQPHMSPF